MAAAHNTAWIGDYKGHRLLFAEGDGTRLALGCSMPFLACSVGFVGFSDGWQMLRASGRLTEEYDRAADGNVALTAEIASPETEFRLALGFGRSAPEAAFPRAREPADAVRAPDGGICHRLALLAGAASLAGPQGGRAQRAIASAPRCCAAMKARRSPAA